MTSKVFFSGLPEAPRWNVDHHARRGTSGTPLKIECEIMVSANHRFPRSHRLSGKLRFAAVYDARTKISRGPLVIYSLPNNLGHLRMGISISRRVGTAPKRNRIKRLIRESFRLAPIKLSRGYDLVVVVRPHQLLPLEDYQTMLAHLIAKSDLHWQRA